MIGTDLNLILPTLSDPLTTIVSKIAVALSTIKDSHAQRATPAALNINSNLSFGGNHATNVGGVVLATGNAPTAAGSFYYSGGYFYIRDATGIIRLSNAGTIDVSSSGAIGGDYGQGGNPATVVYDDASGQYRFKEDATTWADLVADDLVLMESAGGADFVRLTAPAAVTTPYTVTFPAAPPAALSVMHMAADGTLSTSRALAVDSVTASGTITAAVVTAPAGTMSAVSITAGQFYYTNSENIQLDASNARSSTNNTYNPTGGYWVFGNTSDAIVHPLPVRNGDTITGWSIALTKSSGADNTLTARLERVNALTGNQTTVGVAQTNSAAIPGSVVFTVSGLSELVSSVYNYRIAVSQSDITPSAPDNVHGVVFSRKYTP